MKHRLLALLLALQPWVAPPAQADVAISGNVELIVLPPRFAPGIIGNPSTYLYGLNLAYDFMPELTLRGGVFHSLRGDRQLLHVPLTLVYNISGDYPIQLRPYIGLGLDLFVPSLPRPYSTAFNAHVRGGLDYVIDNKWIINAAVTAFIPLPAATDAFTMNLGVVGLSLGFGYKL